MSWTLGKSFMVRNIEFVAVHSLCSCHNWNTAQAKGMARIKMYDSVLLFFLCVHKITFEWRKIDYDVYLMAATAWMVNGNIGSAHRVCTRKYLIPHVFTSGSSWLFARAVVHTNKLTATNAPEHRKWWWCSTANDKTNILSIYNALWKRASYTME